MKHSHGFDEIMIVNPSEPGFNTNQGVRLMRFHYGEPPDMGYYAQPPEAYGYYAESPETYGYYAEPAEPYGYYAESPEPYGYYAESPEPYSISQLYVLQASTMGEPPSCILRGNHG
jgi:hypothetical protein